MREDRLEGGDERQNVGLHLWIMVAHWTEEMWSKTEKDACQLFIVLDGLKFTGQEVPGGLMFKVHTA